MPGAAPNLLLADEARDLHDFSAPAPGERWVTDITELSVPAGRAYLSAVVDLFDGRVVGWAAGGRPTAALAADSLAQALGSLPRGAPAPLVHSDRGMHYRTGLWLGVCERAGVTRSMSRKGHSPDNAAMEGFFGRLKVEMFRGRDWEGVGVAELVGRVGDYVSWYNSGRLKRFGDGPTRHETIDGRRRRLGLTA